MLFNKVAADSHYIGGQPAPDGLIWIRADIRSGRTDEQKKAIMERLASDMSKITGIEKRERLDLYLRYPCIRVEFGHVLPQPGQEDAWFAQLPEALQHRLRELS